MPEINTAGSNLDKCRITIAKRLHIPKPLIEINGIGIASIGDFSTIVGQPKSKKTFLMMLLISAAINKTQSPIKFNLPTERKGIIYIDTEQSAYKTQEIIDKIQELIGIDPDKQIRIYNVRELDIRERIAAIEEALLRHPKAAFVIIDGVRDLVGSINDDGEASTITNKLLKWTKTYDVHMMCILHQNRQSAQNVNKGGRGHLGTEMQNKAETTIEITIINEEQSSIKPQYTRGRSFEGFTFAINEDGLPYIIDKTSTQPLKRKKREPFIPETLSNDFLNKVLKETFEHKTQFSYDNLLNALKQKCVQNNLDIGNTKVSKVIGVCVERELLVHFSGAKNTTIYKLND